jgi:hypothetical protein
MHPINMSASASHQSWFWYLDRQGSLFQLVSNNSWVTHNPLPQRRRSFRTNASKYYVPTPQPCSSPPLLLYAASVEEHPRGFLQALPHSTLSICSDSVPQNLERQCPQSLLLSPSDQPFYQHLLSNLSMDDNQGVAIVESIQHGTMVACSDGSSTQSPGMQHMAWS